MWTHHKDCMIYWQYVMQHSGWVEMQPRACSIYNQSELTSQKQKPDQASEAFVHLLQAEKVGVRMSLDETW